METAAHCFPFSAVIGQDDLKLALLLNIIDPSLGGVLAIGDKGTGKTTLIRSLTHLMNTRESFPFVNLPIGASEDRVIGHINLETLINDKTEKVTPGLLAKADEGFLYVDEINLLNDYLMDILLDASSTGSYHIEREGISAVLKSRFCLIGSMNPEEGNLRPQLKDRFGLSVIISTPNDIDLRSQIIQNRMAFDDAPKSFSKRFKTEEDKLYSKLKEAKRQLKNIELPKVLYKHCAELASAHAVEGLRADILLLKTARAYTAYLGETEITPKQIEAIAPFVLNHRSNDDSNQNQSSKNQEQQKQNTSEKNKERNGQPESTFESVIPESELKNEVHSNSTEKKGIENVLDSINQSHSSLKETTKKQLDTRKTVGQYLATNTFDLKHKNVQNKSGKHIIFLLDSSGSMLKDNIVAFAKGQIEKTVVKNMQCKLSFSLLSLYDNDVAIVVKLSKDAGQLITKLNELKTGGKTNAIAAFKTIKTITTLDFALQNELVIITDGRFNSEGVNDFDNAVTAYQTYCKNIKQLTIVDAETGTVKLGLAKQFAEKVKGEYQILEA